MKYHFTIVLFALALYSCAPKKHKNNSGSIQDIESIVNQIAAGNMVTSSHIGVAGLPSSQWGLYKQLKDNATIEQLVALTEHKNAAVKCYSFQALVANRSDKTFPVLLKKLFDTSKIVIQSGCVITAEMIGDYFFGIVALKDADNKTYTLNPSERNIVDSMLLHNKNLPLASKFTALNNTKPTTGNYARIRELVLAERNESALIILAKYKKKEDRKLIASFFKNATTQYSALFAVREYPDEYFYPFVKSVFENEWKQKDYDVEKWRMCYQALAKYPKPETVKLFERTINTKDRFRYNTVCVSLLAALNKFPDKLFEPIKNKIKLTDVYLDAAQVQMNDKYVQHSPLTGTMIYRTMQY